MSTKGIVEAEVQKFRQLQTHWWNPNGALQSLHQFNTLRVNYIQQTASRFGRPLHSRGAKRPSAKVLDVGCGGGLLSVALARIGADVTGIDACAESVEVASAKAAEINKQLVAMNKPVDAQLKLNFLNTNLFDIHEKYDVVVASEVIEHVDDPLAFLEACCDKTEDGGVVIFSTMEKDLRSLLSHKLAAEYLTGIVLPGTHDWVRFIPSKDLTKCALRFSVRNVDLSYVLPTPSISRSLAVGRIEMDFSLTTKMNTGQYFWSGVKMPRTATPPPPPPQSA